MNLAEQSVFDLRQAILDALGKAIADGPPGVIMTEELISKLYRLEVQVVETDSGLLISPAGLKRRKAL
jgi:ABC-type cobalamin/Fe3+-siderophores transport system ATPase subunit